MDNLLMAIESLMAVTTPVIAIDGPAAAGKSTLAARLGERYGAQVFHMDDFFLQPHQRSEQRLKAPGGNVDYERFLSQVLLPLQTGAPFDYEAYNCQTGLMEPRQAQSAPIYIVEGAYALRPDLQPYYDLKVFLDVDPDLQAARILKRNGDRMARRFFQEWIPLETAYFEAFDIRGISDILLSPTL